MKRIHWLSEGEDVSIETLPPEVLELIFVRVHHQVSHLNTVCKAWHNVIETYTGWLDVALTNYRQIQGSCLEKAQVVQILQRLRNAHCPRRAKFANTIGYILNAKLSNLLALNKPAYPALVLRSLFNYTKEHTKNVLTLKNFHPRDLYLNFTEVGHRYVLILRNLLSGRALFYQTVKPDDNEPNTEPVDKAKLGCFLSVTTFIHTLFPHFDTEAVISMMMANTEKWEDPVANAYYGMTREEIVQQWAEISTLASAAGTAMHANLEYYYSEQPYKTDSKEFALFLAYEAAYVTGKLRAYRTEWTIYSEPLQLCGSVDMLYEYIKPVDHGDGKKHLVMADWKRSKKITMYNMYQSGCVSCTEKMGDTNYNCYCVQLSLYKYILERHYDVIIDAMYLVILHPNQEHFICLPVPYETLKPNFDAIIEHRLSTLSAPL